MSSDPIISRYSNSRTRGGGPWGNQGTPVHMIEAILKLSVGPKVRIIGQGRARAKIAAIL